jgi:hypothetical protein
MSQMEISSEPCIWHRLRSKRRVTGATTGSENLCIRYTGRSSKGPGRPPQPPVPRGIKHGVSRDLPQLFAQGSNFVSPEFRRTCHKL